MYNTHSITMKKAKAFLFLAISLLLMGAGSVEAKKSTYHTGNYRNLLKVAGFKQKDIDKKVNDIYSALFESKGIHQIYFEVGDSMAYVSDVKNRDARTEGLSYGLMVAVQLNKKEVFDKIWRWSKKYAQHQTGSRKGYFAWSIEPKSGRMNSAGSASDGELYFVTALLFASNRWGNDTGIDYYKEARFILDNMWLKDGTDGVLPFINMEQKQINFTPDRGGNGYTDPSYHVPAFYEVWAEYAKDGHEQFYRDCADTSRAYLQRTVHPITGLNAERSMYSGAPQRNNVLFGFDSWRVPMNIAMDYVWYGKDKAFQTDYANRIQTFFRSQGLETFVDQYNMDGTTPSRPMSATNYKKTKHSIGLVSTVTTTQLINGKKKKELDFVRHLWTQKHEPYDDGYFDAYYDGLLYLFSMMHLSGKYQIITPDFNK